MGKEKEKPINKLTPTEAQVYEMILDYREETGETIGNREIADRLGVSRSKVAEIRKSVVGKVESLQPGF